MNIPPFVLFYAYLSFLNLGVFVIRDDTEEVLESWLEVLSEDSDDGEGRMTDGEGVFFLLLHIR
jgi:hypothetical protein